MMPQTRLMVAHRFPSAAFPVDEPGVVGEYVGREGLDGTGRLGSVALLSVASDWGELEGGRFGAPIVCPQFGQNLAPEGTRDPQFGQKLVPVSLMAILSLIRTLGRKRATTGPCGFEGSRSGCGGSPGAPLSVRFLASEQVGVASSWYLNAVGRLRAIG